MSIRSFSVWIGYQSIMLIDCRKKIVVFHPPDIDQFIFTGIHISLRFSLISAMKAQKLLDKGCMSYLASVVDVSVE